MSMVSMQESIRYIVILISFMLLFCCAPSITLTQSEKEIALQKINFDIQKIDEHGLIGPPDGKVLVAYIFNIPIEKRKRKEVAALDPSIRFFKKPTDDQYTCIGEGATQKVLLKLASLSYIKRIDPFYGE